MINILLLLLKKLPAFLKGTGQSIICILLIFKIKGMDTGMSIESLDDIFDRPMLVALSIIAFGSALGHIISFLSPEKN